MQNAIDLPPGNFTEATHRHESQLEEVFLGKLLMDLEAYLLRCVRCHLILSYEDCNWLQGKYLLLWQFEAIWAPKDALGVYLTDTVELLCSCQ